MDVARTEINQNRHPVNSLPTEFQRKLDDFDLAMHDPKNIIWKIHQSNKLFLLDESKANKNIRYVVHETLPWSQACHDISILLKDNDIKFAIALEQEHVNTPLFNKINEIRQKVGLDQHTPDQFQETKTPILNELELYSRQMLNIAKKLKNISITNNDTDMMAFIKTIETLHEKIEQIPENLMIESRELKKEPVEIISLTALLLKDIHDEKANGNHKFKISKPDYPVIVESDPGALKQILENLIFNAIKYSSKNPNGDIDIDITDKSISITDKGWGMTPEKVAKVSQFKKGYRGDDIKDIEGTGHGLPFANKLCNKLGYGDIQVSSPGLTKGSTFTVNFSQK